MIVIFNKTDRIAQELSSWGRSIRLFSILHLQKTNIFNLSIIFSTILIGSIYSCQVQAEEKTFLVGFAQDNMTGDWRSQQVHRLEAALKKYPSIKFIFTDARGQVSKAITDIENLHDMDVDLLVVSPQSPSLLSPAISAVYKSGIPVVLLTRQIQGDDYTTFIAPDDYTISRMAADEISKSLDGKGDVVIIQGLPEASTAIDRTRGFLDQLKNHEGINVSAIKSGNYLRADAVKAMAYILENNIKFDAVFSHSDNMAIGVRIALQAFDINPKTIPIVAIDYISQARDAIIAGEQVASFTYSTSAVEASEVIWDILHGKPVEKHIMVPSVKVTAKNADEIEPDF